MSGGHFDYGQFQIQNIVDSIEGIIDRNENGEAEEWEKYEEDILENFREAVVVLKKAFVYAQRIDYLLSCDDGPDSFRRRLTKELEDLK